MGHRKTENQHDQWMTYSSAKAELINALPLPAELFGKEHCVEEFLSTGIFSSGDKKSSVIDLTDEEFLVLMKFVDGWLDNNDEHLTIFYRERLRRFNRYG